VFIRLFAAFAEIFQWLEEFLHAIAVMLETKRRLRARKRKRRRSEYPCWYYFASSAPGWTAGGGRVGTNE
jgi:hypothetical protein